MSTLARARQAPADSASRPAGSWDPLVRPLAWTAMVVGLVLNSGAIAAVPGVLLPNTVPLLVGFGCVGMAIVVPRARTVVVPMLPMALVAMLIVSVMWSADQASSILWLRTSGIVMLGIVSLALVLPPQETIGVLLSYVRLVLLITLVAVIIEPLARIHIDPLGISPPLKGWHGYFVHKNVMAAFLTFGLGTVLAFDRRRPTRWPSIAAIVFLYAVSDSTTGRMAGVGMVSVFVWFQLNRRLTGRSSSALVASTVAMLSVIGVAIGTSLSAIADAAGKDLTFTGRTRIWAATWRAVLRDPIVGHGVNGLYGTPKTAETALVQAEIGFPAGHPHNGFLDVAVQLGAVGVVLVLAVLVATFRRAARLSRVAPRFAAWGLAVMSGIVVMSVGESVFLGPAVAVIVTVNVVLAQVTAERLGTDRGPVPSRRGSAAPAGRGLSGRRPAPAVSSTPALPAPRGPGRATGTR